MGGTHGTVSTEWYLRNQDWHDGGGGARPIALDCFTLALTENVCDLLFVRIGGGRYRDTGAEDVNPCQGRKRVVQGCRLFLLPETVGHAVQVLEITVVTVKSGFLYSGSSRGITGPTTTAAVSTTQQFPTTWDSFFKIQTMVCILGYL